MYALDGTRAYIRRQPGGGSALEEFDAFFRREFPKVARSLGFAVGDVELGADLAQESFSRALARWDGYQDESHARHSIMQIGMNLARSHWRRARRVFATGLDPGTRAESLQVDREDRVVIEKALSALSRRQRECAVLVDYLGFDSVEAGTILGIPGGTVRVHLGRARQNLAVTLGALRQEETGG